MMRLGDVLRQLHLIVEAVVVAEDQASNEYAVSLLSDALNRNWPRVEEAIRERIQRRQG